jgi:hypothetical protein
MALPALTTSLYQGRLVGSKAGGAGGIGRLVGQAERGDLEAARFLQLPDRGLAVAVPDCFGDGGHRGGTRGNPFVDGERMTAGDRFQVLQQRFHAAVAHDDVGGAAGQREREHEDDGGQGDDAGAEG